MDLGATFPRQDCMFKYLAKIFSWSGRLLKDVLAKFRRKQGVFSCMQLFASKAPCLSPHVILIQLSSQRHRSSWRKTSFGLNAASCPLKKQGFLAAYALLSKSLHKLFDGNLFYVMARALCNEFYVITPRSLPLSFPYVKWPTPALHTQNAVLQVWLLDARWTTWELCIEAKNNARAFSVCKMFFFWGGGGGVKVFLGNAR